jgi:hypothetical protein
LERFREAPEREGRVFAQQLQLRLGFCWGVRREEKSGEGKSGGGKVYRFWAREETELAPPATATDLAVG